MPTSSSSSDYGISANFLIKLKSGLKLLLKSKISINQPPTSISSVSSTEFAIKLSKLLKNLPIKPNRMLYKTHPKSKLQNKLNQT